MTYWIAAIFPPVLAVGNGLYDWITGPGLFHLAVVAAAFFLVWQGVNWGERLRTRRAVYSQTPRALFRELCQAHALQRGDRQLLGLIAQQLPDAQCCRVFIDRQLIDNYTSANPADADECRHLARRLFGS